MGSGFESLAPHAHAHSLTWPGAVTKRRPGAQRLPQASGGRPREEGSPLNRQLRDAHHEG
jgi:hypothetical protein